ncbi:MAG: NAD-dependent epimerase/dehydratase family protein [Lysobacterales bacterium]|nr:NAD-dependent epimerase/dehydratase family protein [Xanthomonadales bacterium]MCB1613826.1 NAD-dependent epimerase/dehydratase family protein [Xanthomonadales bacterium]MCP5475698.1 NAD-dependent epimerase/dehydratase family protein [Rhodanobacteraceae bacterium]
MTVLVTGAAGFIGAYVAKALSARGERVLGLDSFNDYYPVALKRDRARALGAGSSFEMIEGDVADQGLLERIWREHAPTRVVHLAAQAGVRYSIEAPRPYVHSNLVGFLEILEACRQHQVQHLVCASTSSLYGQNPVQPFREDARIDRPLSLYAATKGANELMAHSYAHLYRIPITALRFFTVYGPWGRPDMAPLLFTRAILAGKPIQVFNHGQMKRDFTHVNDIVAGVIGALDAPPAAVDGAAPYRVFNLGRGEPVDLMRFIELIEEAAGQPAERLYKDMQSGDMLETFADIGAARAAFGYQPQTSIEAGVPVLVEWCRNYAWPEP